MLHITCDLCGKHLQDGDSHFVVKMEVFRANDPVGLTEADLDADHMEALGQLLHQLESLPVAAADDTASRSYRYDLCSSCRNKFVQAPLARDAASKFDFSEN